MVKLTSVAAFTLGTVLLGGCASTLNQLPSLDDQSNQAIGYDDRLSRGLYAVAGIGPSRLEPDASQVEAFTVNDRVEPAGQITLGADLTKHLSIEAHSADLGSAGFSPSGRINYNINGASALYYAGGNRGRFRRQGLTAYGRVGVGVLENTPVGDVPFTKVNDTHILVGAGVEYMTPIGVGLRAEGISFDEDVRYAQLGVMYRTGRKQGTRVPKLASAPEQESAVIAAALPAPVEAVPDQCAALSGVLEGVGFHSDSDGLTRQSIGILNQVANTLSTCDRTAIHVQAHTDAQGSENYNKDLSKRRALTVVKFLVSSGLNKNRMRATAFGESQPIDSNDTASGRARNRRVEVHIR